MIATWLTRYGLAAALICFGGVTHAQQPSASAVAAARELLQVKGATTMVDVLVPGIVETVKNNFLPTHPTLSKDFNEVAVQLRAEFAGRRNDILNEVATIYARRFSEQELKDIIAFYKSPVGQKFVKEEPGAVDDSLSRAQSWSNTVSEQVIARFRTEMKKKGHDL